MFAISISGVGIQFGIAVIGSVSFNAVKEVPSNY